MEETKVQEVDINDLVQDKRNFNKGNEQGQQLMERSFKELGAGRSILLDRNGNIIAGNKSQQAAIAAGIKKVRVIETTGDELVAVKRTDVDIDSAEGRRMAYLDNLTTQVNLTWDETELEAVQADVEGFDIADFGFDIEDLPQVTFPTGEKQSEGEGVTEPETTEDDFDEEKETIEKRATLGDLWQLGAHRLCCGDSTSTEDVSRLLGEERADMVFTDPPYGIEYGGGRKSRLGMIKNDDLQGNELGNLICNVFEYNKQGADVYICVSPIMQKPFLDYIESQGKQLNAVIVWDKRQPGLGYMAYRRQCEFILFIKGGKFHMGDKSDVDLWSISRDDGQTYVHGTQKPIGVSGRAITNSSKEGDIILDYFGGSGSTMIACEQLGRKCRMMELDPHYCDVIIARWEKLTGQKAVKLNP